MNSKTLILSLVFSSTFALKVNHCPAAAVCDNRACKSFNGINDHDCLNHQRNSLNNFNHSKLKKICVEEKEDTNCNNLNNFSLNKDIGVNHNCGDALCHNY